MVVKKTIQICVSWGGRTEERRLRWRRSGKARESECETWSLPLKLRGREWRFSQTGKSPWEFRSAQDRGRSQTYSDVGTPPGFLGGVLLPERGPPSSALHAPSAENLSWERDCVTQRRGAWAQNPALWGSSSSVSLMSSVSLVRVLSLSWICFLPINWGQQQCLIHRTLVKM